MRRTSERAQQVVLAALTEEATTTSDLYDRVGYMALVRVGLIDFRAFRDVRAALERQGLADGWEGPEDRGSRWRLRARDEPAA